MPAPAAPPTTAPRSGLKPVAAPNTAPEPALIAPPVTARWPQVSPQALAVRRMAARTMYLRIACALLGSEGLALRPVIRFRLGRKVDESLWRNCDRGGEARVVPGIPVVRAKPRRPPPTSPWRPCRPWRSRG